MFIQLTSAGLALLASGPFVLDKATFGDGYNYVPDPLQASLQGSTVFTSTPGPAFPINANVVRYSIMLDRSVGDFDFGEIGLWVGPTLVAVGVNSTLISKSKSQSGTDGNLIRVDAFLSMVGTTYEMWLNLGDTDNKYVVSSADLVDYLPPVHDTIANAFIVGAPTSDMLAFFAYSDRSGIWAFDQYKYSTVVNHRYTVVDASPMQVTISDASLTPHLDPSGLGERILQFTTGACYSVCRNIQQAVEDLQTDRTVLIFNTPLAVVPTVGDEFVVYNRDPLSTTTVNLPIATRDDPGIVKVGDGLDVEIDGTIYVDRETIPNGIVYSIIGKALDGSPVSLQGDVQLHIRDIAAGVATVNGQGPDASGNVTLSTGYNLPIASDTVLGGVRVSSGSGLEINPATGQLSLEASGSQGVKTVNSKSPDSAGNVNILGLVDPQIQEIQFDVNNLTWPGLYQIRQGAIAGSFNLPIFAQPTEEALLEVAPLDGDDPESIFVQRWTQKNGFAWRFFRNGAFTNWFDPTVGGQVIATTSRLGSVIVGAGLAIDGSGVLSTALRTVNGRSPDPLTGDVQVEASDISAIPYEEKGEPGGVATLSGDPDNPAPDPYLEGRIPLDQEALESLVYRGEWNADINEWKYTDDLAREHTVVLKDNGFMDDTFEEDPGVVVTYTRPGIGTVLYTTVTGDTEIDGVLQWYAGDLVIGLTNKWIRVSSVPAVPVQELQFGISIPNTVTPSSVLFFQVVADALVTSNAKDNVASCRVAPSSAVVFDIQVDGVSVGTIGFANSSTTGVVDFPSDVHLSPSSEITIVSPSDVHSIVGLAVYLTFDME